MVTNRTFTMLKPDSVEKGNIGAILEKINSAGFRIVAMKLTQMSDQDAKSFYSIHKDKPFYSDLVDFMSSERCMVLALEKDNAVFEWRQTIGATNPDEADEGTIRKLYASSLGENAVHGSDSDENAKKEIAFFFNESELT